MQKHLTVFSLDNLNSKLAELNKKLSRIGGTPATLTVERKYTTRIDVSSKWDRRYTQTIEVPAWDVMIDYEIFKICDFTLIGTIDHKENLVHTAPDQQMPSHYRSRGAHCDHCHTDRERNLTIIIRKDNGAYMQLGTSCLSQYVGIDAASILAMSDAANFAATLFDEMEDDAPTKHSRGEYALIDYMTAVTAAVEKFGFISKSNAGCGESPTSETALDTLLNKEFKPTEKQIRQAQIIIDWMLSIDPHSANDYMLNLRQIANNGFCTRRSIGYAASAIAAYNRSQEEKAQPAESTSQYVGTIGKRQSFTNLTVQRVFSSFSAYGARHMHIMTDENGSVIVWTATNGTQLEEGDQISGKATPEKHDDYKGTKQTTVKRFTIEEARNKEGEPISM